MEKRKYVTPEVVAISVKKLGEAYYGAMASSCCGHSTQRCG